MNYNVTVKNNLALIALAIVAILFVFYFISIHQPEFLSIDSAQYVSVAKNIINNGEFSTDILYYEKQYQQAVLPAAQTIFPPGYSILIALVSLLGVSLINASFWVNLFSFITSIILIYKILRISTFSYSSSITAAMLWAMFSANWHYVLISMSEIPFIFMVLLGLYLIIRYEKNGSGFLLLVSASLVFGFLFWVRYAGLFFILAISAYQLYLLIKDKSRRRIYEIVVFHSIAYAFVFFLFARNYYYLGEISGGPKLDNGGTIIQLAQNLYWSLNKLLGADSGEIFYQLLRLMLLVFFVTITYFFVKNRRACNELSHDKTRLIFLSGLLLSSYMGSLFILAYKFEGDFINIRYLIPVVPFISILLVVLISTFYFRITHKTPFVVLCASVLVTFFAAQLIYNLNENEWLSSVKERFGLVATMQQQKTAEDLSVIDLLDTEISTSHPVLAPRGQVLAALLNIPLIGLTQKKFTHRVWDEQAVKKVIKIYQIQYLLLPVKSYDRNLGGNQNQVFFNQLYDGERFAWLTSAAEHKDFLLFKVNSLL